jgi:hypothetical protein
MLNKIKWLGNFFSIVGAFIVAMQYLTLGYCFFLIGSGAWFYSGIVTKDKALISLNLFFLVADFIGLYNAIFS